MGFKKVVKRIVALGTGASMVGATIFGAMAADLADYPSQYIKDGKFAGVLVVGDKAAAEDVIGVSDIAVSLQFAATKPVTVTSTGGVTAEGDAWQVKTATKNLELSELHKETLRNVSTFIDSSELDALASGTVSNTKGDAPYNQYLYLLGPDAEANVDTGYVEYLEDEQDVTADFLYFKSGEQIARYVLEFTTALESDVDDSAGTATTTGTYLTDYEDVDFNMFGKSFSVVAATRTSATTNEGNTIKLLLMSGAVKDTLLEGNTKTYTIDGTDYEVTLDFVSSTQTKFTINGEATRLMKDGDTDKLSDGTQVGVSEILYQDYAGGVHSATFYLGAQKVELKDTNVEDKGYSNNLKVADDTIDDAYVVIEGTNDNTTFKLDRISINMTADDDFYVPAGGKLSENPELSEPQVLFTQNWDIEYRGLEEQATEKIEIATSGSSKYILKFQDGNGNQAKLPFAKATSGVLRMAGDTDGKSFINVENLTIAKNDFFVLTDSSQKRGERKTYIYQYKGADKLTADSPVLKFEDQGSGESTTQSYTNSSTLATLKVGGADYDVYRVDLVDTASASLASNDFVIRIDLDSSGALNPQPNSSIVITTDYGMEINVTNVTAGTAAPANKINVTFRVADDDADSGARDAAESLVPSTYKVDVGESSAEVTFAATVTSLTERTPEGETDVQYTYNSYGSFFTRKSPSNDPGTLEIVNPESQRYAQVFITTKGTTFAETAAATTTDAVTVQRIDVGATKLASEVPNIKAVNSILVGGPCANAAAATVMGNPADCLTAIDIGPGEGIIKLYDVDGNVAMLVAGYAAEDTRVATSVVANYGEYTDQLKGSAVKVTTATSKLTEFVETAAEGE